MTVVGKGHAFTLEKFLLNISAAKILGAGEPAGRTYDPMGRDIVSCPAGAKSKAHLTGIFRSAAKDGDLAVGSHMTRRDHLTYEIHFLVKIHENHLVFIILK